VDVDLSGAEEFGRGTGRNGDWLRPRCLSLFLPVPLSSTAEEPEEPNEFELNSIRNDPRKLEILRLRLRDLGWWMRVLCQYIAVRANREDDELGKFWQSRFRAVRLLDEAALLACAAYVDLNPIRGVKGTGSVRGACPTYATNEAITLRCSAEFSHFHQKITIPPQGDTWSYSIGPPGRWLPDSEERLRRRHLSFSSD
jgi:hypothetical protein